MQQYVLHVSIHVNDDELPFNAKLSQRELDYSMFHFSNHYDVCKESVVFRAGRCHKLLHL